MEQSIITEHDCNVLGGLFQIVINDLKNGTSTWEDFLLKATKFQAQLKSTISASTAFLDAFQKVADMATTTRGGTKEIGTALTRLCLRQRSVEAKLKSFASALLDCLIIPLQARVEEWKKATIQLDKERTKDLKRLRQEFKKRQLCDSHSASGTLRSKKHSSRLSKGKFDFFDSLNSKGIYGTIGGGNHKSSSSLSRSLDSEMDCNERLLMLEELEKQCVRRALIEERSHFCLFVRYLRPLIEEEVSMIGEVSHIQEVMDSLLKLTDEPDDLPLSSEIALSHLKLNKNDTLAWNLHTPPSSPSSLGSRKSSLCSISSLNSLSNSNNQTNYGHTNHQNKYFNDISKSVYGADFLYNHSGTSTPANEYSSNVNELQFPIETNEQQSINNSNLLTTKKNTIKITSTNPFLSSYNQMNNNNDDESDVKCVYNKQQSSSTNLMPNQESSDGSITPTNITSSSSSSAFDNNHQAKNDEKIYSSKSSKPPPAPPVRRTSSLSNPNAITIGTLLKNNVANVNKQCYDGKNSSLSLNSSSLYDEINVLTKSMNDINFTLKNTDFTNSTSFAKTDNFNNKSSISNESKVNCDDDQQQSSANDSKSDYRVVKRIFENLNQPETTSSTSSAMFSSQNNKSMEDDGSQLPLPAPPPEAFIEHSSVCSSSPSTTSCQSAPTQHHHYNKITNVHREFLETLNNKLSQSPLVYQNNTRISKRRNSNQSIPDDYTASYSGKHRNSNRSSSASRISSRKNSIEKNNGFSVSNSLNSTDFVDKLSQSLLLKQQPNANELAKAAVSNVLQRKQSVPDLYDLNTNLKNQNRVTFSSSLNLNSSMASNQAFQVVNIQTNSTQQPIYSSRTQLRQEIQDLYGSLGNHNYYSGNNNNDRSSYYQQNGFFNKL